MHLHWFMLAPSTDKMIGFGLILWEMTKREKPYSHFNQHMMLELVAKGGRRPPIPFLWPKEISQLLRSCWHADPKQRPVSC